MPNESKPTNELTAPLAVGSAFIEGIVLQTETIKGITRKEKGERPYHLQKTTLLCHGKPVVMTESRRGDDGPLPPIPVQGSVRRFSITPSMQDNGILCLNGALESKI
ncbi:hypothetical protein [Ruficoccus sp. ZRK36]|uniref:hypothetical protein n=1 Tax=Ruficoccus sp. ZRK36 TaxID=2866311 RepID=UPI001C73DCDF|nr:hypothetical protein [Ruficoccus sp. ZRK36]QYY35169.1 hypothetical protein K0V07_12790 [Ruficoccus sp. ZRK36]